jgi:hypothetical protein
MSYAAASGNGDMFLTCADNFYTAGVSIIQDNKNYMFVLVIIILFKNTLSVGHCFVVKHQMCSSEQVIVLTRNL